MNSDPTAQFDSPFQRPRSRADALGGRRAGARARRALLAHHGAGRRTAARDPADRRRAEDEVVHFCTGLREQKARNLEENPHVALTTGNNTWAEGLDVVVEGTAVRVADNDTLQRLADAYEAKYGSVWHFDVGDGVFGSGEDAAAVFRIEPAKVLAFAKEPHAQTTYRFTGR